MDMNSDDGTQVDTDLDTELDSNPDGTSMDGSDIETPVAPTAASPPAHTHT